MTAELVVFYVLGTLTVLSALAVVVPPFGRNPLHAAVALLATFSFLAGLFVLLSAHLVAVLQVLVYAGAVMVLFLFVVMLLNLRKPDLVGARVTWWKVAGGVAAVAIAARLAAGLLGAPEATPADLSAEALQGYGGIRDVGGELVMTYLFPFEAVSLLLLVAIIGALVVSRRRAPADLPGAPGPGAVADPVDHHDGAHAPEGGAA